MPASRRPRKAYRPRLINAPVTAGLVGDFAAVLRRAELGLHLRAPTVEHFDDVARVLNVVGPVVIRRFGATHEVSVAVKSAALHMNAAADRARAGEPRMRDVELEAVSRAIEAVTAALPYLDVRSIYQQMRAIDVLRTTEETTA